MADEVPYVVRRTPNFDCTAKGCIPICVFSVKRTKTAYDNMYEYILRIGLTRCNIFNKHSGTASDYTGPGNAKTYIPSFYALNTIITYDSDPIAYRFSFFFSFFGTYETLGMGRTASSQQHYCNNIKKIVVSSIVRTPMSVYGC